MTLGHVCYTEVIPRINTRIMLYKNIRVLKTSKPQVFLTIFGLAQAASSSTVTPEFGNRCIAKDAVNAQVRMRFNFDICSCFLHRANHFLL